MQNMTEVHFSALSQNENFARAVIAAFASQMNPTLEQLSDIRTAVSEAVTNAIIHGYEQNPLKLVSMICRIDADLLTVTVRDEGCGIADIDLARKPFYTSKPELERSGMGFAVMEAFMDHVTVESTPGQGTTVKMEKRICHGE
ncbi:MAG: anti-sigma F factor [Clostridia bacterium]|jgi:stage II sporulation protein AB (anti-sigma F factor)|nr:anti-sigma F factor [Clostridia bacterium]MBR3272260.1 anti-sigma F factor [Clostridia bacterium]